TPEIVLAPAPEIGAVATEKDPLLVADAGNNNKHDQGAALQEQKQVAAIRNSKTITEERRVRWFELQSQQSQSQGQEPGAQEEHAQVAAQGYIDAGAEEDHEELEQEYDSQNRSMHIDSVFTVRSEVGDEKEDSENEQNLYDVAAEGNAAEVVLDRMDNVCDVQSAVSTPPEDDCFDKGSMMIGQENRNYIDENPVTQILKQRYYSVELDEKGSVVGVNQSPVWSPEPKLPLVEEFLSPDGAFLFNGEVGERTPGVEENDDFGYLKEDYEQKDQEDQEGNVDMIKLPLEKEEVEQAKGDEVEEKPSTAAQERTGINDETENSKRYDNAAAEEMEFLARLVGAGGMGTKSKLVGADVTKGAERVAQKLQKLYEAQRDKAAAGGVGDEDCVGENVDAKQAKNIVSGAGATVVNQNVQGHQQIDNGADAAAGTGAQPIQQQPNAGNHVGRGAMPNYINQAAGGPLLSGSVPQFGFSSPQPPRYQSWQENSQHWENQVKNSLGEIANQKFYERNQLKPTLPAAMGLTPLNLNFCSSPVPGPA
ncbi:unnamed protein product, partial [Amoebophrya sp. A120]